MSESEENTVTFRLHSQSSEDTKDSFLVKLDLQFSASTLSSCDLSISDNNANRNKIWQLLNNLGSSSCPKYVFKPRNMSPTNANFHTNELPRRVKQKLNYSVSSSSPKYGFKPQNLASTNLNHETNELPREVLIMKDSSIRNCRLKRVLERTTNFKRNTLNEQTDKVLNILDYSKSSPNSHDQTDQPPKELLKLHNNPSSNLPSNYDFKTRNSNSTNPTYQTVEPPQEIPQTQYSNLCPKFVFKSRNPIPTNPTYQTAEPPQEIPQTQYSNFCPKSAFKSQDLIPTKQSYQNPTQQTAERPQEIPQTQNNNSCPKSVFKSQDLIPTKQSYQNKEPLQMRTNPGSNWRPENILKDQSVKDKDQEHPSILEAYLTGDSLPGAFAENIFQSAIRQLIDSFGTMNLAGCNLSLEQQGRAEAEDLTQQNGKGDCGSVIDDLEEPIPKFGTNDRQ